MHSQVKLSTAIILTGALLQPVFAQDFISDLPICGQSCYIGIVDILGCSFSDLSCICDSSLFNAQMQICMQDDCGASDMQAATNTISSLCSGAGSSFPRPFANAAAASSLATLVTPLPTQLVTATISGQTVTYSGVVIVVGSKGAKETTTFPFSTTVSTSSFGGPTITETAVGESLLPLSAVSSVSSSASAAASSAASTASSAASSSASAAASSAAGSRGNASIGNGGLTGLLLAVSAFMGAIFVF